MSFRTTGGRVVQKAGPPMVSESDAAPNEQPEPKTDAKVQRRLPQEAQDNVDLAVRASSRCLPLLAENKCIQFRTAYGVPVWHCHHFALILHGMCRCVRLFCAGLRVMNVNLTSISSLPPPTPPPITLRTLWTPSR